MPDEKATLNIEMTPELFDLIKNEARRLQVSMADFMRLRAIEYFDKFDKEQNSGNRTEARVT